MERNHDALETIAEALNVKLRKIYVPKSIAWLGGLILEPLEMLRLNPPLCRRKYVEMTANCVLDIAKTRKQLGYEPQDNFKEYIKEAVEWYRENKLL